LAILWANVDRPIVANGEFTEFSASRASSQITLCGISCSHRLRSGGESAEHVHADGDGAQRQGHRAAAAQEGRAGQADGARRHRRQGAAGDRPEADRVRRGNGRLRAPARPGPRHDAAGGRRRRAQGCCCWRRRRQGDTDGRRRPGTTPHRRLPRDLDADRQLAELQLSIERGGQTDRVSAPTRARLRRCRWPRLRHTPRQSSRYPTQLIRDTLTITAVS